MKTSFGPPERPAQCGRRAASRGRWERSVAQNNLVGAFFPSDLEEGLRLAVELEKKDQRGTVITVSYCTSTTQRSIALAHTGSLLVLPLHHLHLAPSD